MRELLLLLLFVAVFPSVPSQSLEKDQAESDRKLEVLLEKYINLIREAYFEPLRNATNNSTEEQPELSKDNRTLVGPCIRNSVQLYNLSMDFQDTVITTNSFIF